MEQINIFGEAEPVCIISKVKEKLKPKPKKEEPFKAPIGQTSVFDYIEDLPQIGKVYGVKIQPSYWWWLATSRIMEVTEQQTVKLSLTYGGEKHFAEWTLKEFWEKHKAYTADLVAYKKG